MSGVDPTLISHHLAVHPYVRPIIQGHCLIGAKRCRAVKEEVDRLSMANFIREVAFDSWIVDVVLEEAQWKVKDVCGLYKLE